MRRYLFFAVPVALTLFIILFPVVNPSLVPVNVDACGEYCECKHQCGEIRETGELVQIPAQPLNTWSNLAFLVVAIIALRQRRNPTAIWFAVSCILLCIGSAAFHSFLSKAGQRWDVIGMFFVFNFLAIYAMFVTHEVKWFRIAVLISAVVSIVMARFVVNLSTTVVLLVASLFIIGHLVIAVIDKTASWKEVLWVLFPFAIAFAFRQMDVNGILCNPESFYQGHALWHIFAAWGVYEIYRLLDTIRFERHHIVSS